MQKSSSEIEIFEELVASPDLALPRIHVLELFWGTAAQPEASTHTKAQTDGRRSQTIVRIQSREAKRENFPGFSA